MSRCDNCGVFVVDKTNVCPLCRGVLDVSDGMRTIKNYPDIVEKRRKLVLARRIVLFVGLVAMILCGYIDYQFGNDISWGLITGGGILYGLRVFFVFTDPETGYLQRIFAPLFWGVILVLLIDYVTGKHGWSLNFVLPGALLFLNVVLLLLMIINRRNWQSYMIYQIISIIVALVPLVLIFAGIVTHPLLSELAFLSCLFVFLGTLILGGREARSELQRRFHIN